MARPARLMARVLEMQITHVKGKDNGNGKRQHCPGFWPGRRVSCPYYSVSSSFSQLNLSRCIEICRQSPDAECHPSRIIQSPLPLASGWTQLIFQTRQIVREHITVPTDVLKPFTVSPLED